MAEKMQENVRQHLYVVIDFFWLYVINGGHRYSLKLFLRRNIFNGGNTDVLHRFYLRD